MVCKKVKERLDGQIRFGMKVVISADSFGYMDIVHNGDKVIEVKRISVNVTLACAQLLSYISGTWVGSLRAPALFKHVKASDTDIYGYFMYEGYCVVYAGLGNGIVLYDYYDGKDDQDKIDEILEELRKKKKEYNEELGKGLGSSGSSSSSSAIAMGGAMFVCVIAFGLASAIPRNQRGWK